MEISHSVNFKSDKFNKFIKYIETLKRQKLTFNFNGSIFKEEGERTNVFSVHWITEEDK